MLVEDARVSELVMVIEDEKDIRDLVRYNLEKAGYRVAAAADGEEGLTQLFASRPDALVLDLMLPGANGLEILRELRSEPTTHDLPVLVLTARSAEMDKLLGFEHGADDYLTKPFSPRELVARVKALVRRARPTGMAHAIVWGPLTVDLDAHEARLADVPLGLTPREFDLLAFLARHPRRALTRDELLRKVWGYDYVGETRTVDVHVRRLRAKLGDAHGCIETVLGAGYKFVPPVPEGPA
ncbi:MAG TPA: response regulator transcription factor [Candidatus Eisenbacteria bacterium]|jgi:DNA-binding response OmpR family regulator